MKACFSLFLAVKNGSSDIRLCVCVRTPRRGESSDWQCQLGSAFLARLQILEEEGEGKKRIVGRREKRQKREKSTCQRHKSDSFPN